VFASEESDVLDVDHPIIRFWSWTTTSSPGLKVKI
jgi:hypothetical protein